MPTFPMVLKIDDKEIPLQPKLQSLLIEQGRLYWKILQAIFVGGSVEVEYDSELRMQDFSRGKGPNVPKVKHFAFFKIIY